MIVSGNVHNEVRKSKHYCDERRFDNAVKEHNRREKHINPHELLISSMQWKPEIHYGMTTANNIMNIGRAINAGEVTKLHLIPTVRSTFPKMRFVCWAFE